MRSRIVYSLLALLLLAACSSSAASAPEISSKEDVPRITPQEVVAQQEAGEQIVLADARSFESYQERHIAGAISVPMLEVGDYLDELPKKTQIVFYCTWPAEATSAGAALNLYELGYTNVSALLGGMMAWEEAGYAVE